MFDSASRRSGHTTASGVRPIRTLLAGVGTLLAAGALAAPAQAAFPGDNGRVVYDANQRTSDFWTSFIFSSAADGTGATQLAGDPTGTVSAWDASASADGRSLAYFSGQWDDSLNQWAFRLYRSGLDGSNPVRLVPSDDFAMEPAWSPDGTQIAYISRGTRNLTPARTAPAVSERSSNDTLWIASADNSGTPAPVRLDGWEGGDVEEPQWSPDGKWIAFDNRSSVYVVSAQGGTPAQVDTDGAYRHAYPNWAPDGSKLVYSSNDDSLTSTIVTRAIANGVPTGKETTIGSGTYADTPVFSPDGTKVMWSVEPTTQQVSGWSAGTAAAPSAPDYAYLVVAAADGTGDEQFLDHAPTGDVDEPEWAPVPKVAPQPTPTPTPTPSPTSTPTPVPSTGGVKGEHAHRCGSRRNFEIRLRPKGAKIVKARVLLRGKRVAVRKRHGRWVATVDLRTLPKKRFAVSITTWTAGGKRFHEVRRYWTCTPAL